MILRSPLGIVLAGGGAHGSWQAGCVESLVEAGLVFDRILGVSVGSLMGAAYLLGQLPEVIGFWKDIDRRNILRFAPRLRPFSLFSGSPIREALQYAQDEERARRIARCELVVVSLCVDDGNYHYARFTPGGREGWDGPLTERLVASCAVPRVFPPVTLSAGGVARTYVDGGARGRSFASFEAMAGCRDILLIQMVRPDEIGRIKSVFQLAGDQLGRDLAHGLQTLLSLAQGTRVFRLFPSMPLAFTPFDFRSRCCAPALDRGRYDGRAFAADPERFLVIEPLKARHEKA